MAIRSYSSGFNISFIRSGAFPLDERTREELLFLENDKKEYTVFPGFADVHVHLREPGFSYKETIASGSLAAAHGGYTAVCAMPNLDPVPDSPDHLKAELDIIKRDAVINVLPYGALTIGEKGLALSDLDAMAKDAVAFSDDGKGVQSENMMREAMLRCASLGKVLAAHCEDETLLKGGYIHDGGYAKAHGHRGICSESEWRQVGRDIKLAEETGCAYHICHVSTKESVALVRAAKARGVDVTCETAPHYLLLDDSDIHEDGSWKMNPPLRDKTDREALIEGILDGTVDMIATDHAPHSDEEKSRGLEKSLFGITGIELAFPLLYTRLVLPGVITLEKLVDLICYAPRKRFGIPLTNDFTVWDLSVSRTVTPEGLLSKGKATPFNGALLTGECVLTVCGGRAAYTKNF